MVVGHPVNTIPLLGSRRRTYFLLDALLQAAASFTLAAGHPGPATAQTVYVAVSLLAVTCLVVQDCIADVLTTEVVAHTNPDGTPRNPTVAQAEFGDVQALGRYRCFPA